MGLQILSNINRLYPRFGEIVQKVLDECDRQGLEVVLFETERTWDRQVYLWRKGRDASGNTINPKECVTWATPGWSPHHYGLAADIVFLNAKGQPSWDNKMPWQSIGNISTKLKLEWGGNWSKPKVDLPHHQKMFRPVGMNEAVWYKAIRAEYWKDKDKAAVWKLLDKKLNFS